MNAADSLRRGHHWLAVAILALALAACGDREPIRIGFLGGVSGRVADLGIGGRNGAQLAIEQRNAAGGIDGRPVELVVEDDQQDPDVAKAALDRLIARKVVAVVGPMTSAMAVAVAPQADAAHLLLLSPTATTTQLSGKDDYFLRVLAPTTAYAHKSARHHYDVDGLQHVAAIYDLRNKAYTESWLADYRQAFEAAGGRIDLAIGFESSAETQFAELVEQLLTTSPDGVLILANSVDTALLAQQVRKRDARVRICTSEWAATERLLELGGKAVDGVIVAQFIDRDSKIPSYVAFREKYLQRFGHAPGFPGLTGFDATNVILDALAANPSGQDLKQTILARKRFTGAQSPLVFDAHGDAARETFLTVIRDGQFKRLD